MKSVLLGISVTALVISSASAAAIPSASDGEASYRALLKEMVETDSSKISGSCTLVAERVAAWMKGQGFPAGHIKVYAPDDDPKGGNLLVVWPGRDTKAKALMLNGHIDVVNAKPSDWTRNPYAFIEENGRFYGRGVADMKAQSAMFIDTVVRLYKHGYQPRHTIKVSLTCGEEAATFTNGVAWLGKTHRAEFDAGLVLSEGGGGTNDDKGQHVVMSLAAAEKRGANFQLQVTDSGGHSSVPKDNNAIYVMSRALERLEKFDFPVMINEENRAQFKVMGPIEGGALGQALVAIANNPGDAAAKAVIDKSPRYKAITRTICTPTQIEGGHAPNAVPQRVVVNINCRIMPRTELEEVRGMLCDAIGDSHVEILGPNPPSHPNPPMEISEQFLATFKRLAAVHFPGVPVTPVQIAAGTDAKRFRVLGMATWGLSGIFGDSQTFMHGLNESISVKSVMDARPFVYDAVKAFDAASFYDAGLMSAPSVK